MLPGPINTIMRYKDIITETSRPDSRLLAHEVLLKAGYDVLGSGCYASIYEKPGASYVLKLFDSVDTAYLAFLRLAQANSSNPHFPKLFKKPVLVAPGYFAIRMEKLSTYHGDPELFKIYMIYRDYKFKDPTSHYANRMGDAEELFYENPSLKEALDLLIDNMPGDCLIDMQPTNVMVRGTTIVFTDPYKNEKADDDRKPIPMPERPVTTTQRRDPAHQARLDAILSDDDLMRELGF